MLVQALFFTGQELGDASRTVCVRVCVHVNKWACQKVKERVQQQQKERKKQTRVREAWGTSERGGTSCNLVRSSDFLFTLEYVRVCPNSLQLSLCCHGHNLRPETGPETGQASCDIKRSPPIIWKNAVVQLKHSVFLQLFAQVVTDWHHESH